MIARCDAAAAQYTRPSAPRDAFLPGLMSIVIGTRIAPGPGQRLRSRSVPHSHSRLRPLLHVCDGRPRPLATARSRRLLARAHMSNHGDTLQPYVRPSLKHPTLLSHSFTTFTGTRSTEATFRLPTPPTPQKLPSQRTTPP